MQPKVILTIEIILHATEDITKIEKSLSQTLEINSEFVKEEMSGHFDNPITILKAKIPNNDTSKLINKLMSKISDNDLKILDQEIDEMKKNSGLQIRLSKQDLIRGRISFEKKDSVKLIITTPVYKKNEIGRIYREILNIR